MDQAFIKNATDVARQAAKDGSRVALSYFKKGIQAEEKTDASPVTIADKEAEAAIIDRIRGHFPDHSILAEESGVTDHDPRYRWIIDPIDGTRGFIRGGSFWGCLVALELDGDIVAGAMALPVLDTLYWAGKGLGCYRNDSRIFVSKTEQWRDATLSVGEVQHLLQPHYREAVCRLISGAASTRGYGDPGGLMMVLEGLADVWLEAGVKPWDLAPAKILIEEAGGRFSNFAGQSSLSDGTAIASNGLLHQEVLRALQGA
jgi:histidinol-phosphatase